MSSPDLVGTAEQAFRDAFDRLKRGKPIHLEKGAKVTQNNVAKEADRDPTALRKSRYPRLIREIQQWVQDHDGEAVPASSPAALLQGTRKKNRDLKARIIEVEAQRDAVISRLLAAEVSLLEMAQDNERLSAQLGLRNTVVPHKPVTSRRD
jgi:hypothetical protein